MLWGFWLVIVPESLIIRVIENTQAGKNTRIKTSGLSKGIFYSVSIERVILNKRDNPLLVFQEVHLTPDIMALLTFKPRVKVRGKINTGSIHGSIGREEGIAIINMNGNNIQTNGLPLLAQFGVTGDGLLSFQLQQAKKRGEIIFSINEAQLRGTLGGIGALPLTVFSTVKGSLITGEIISIQSLTIEGKGIYARLKGDIADNKLRGNIEIMMNPSFDLYPLLQVALKQYLVSPGHYSIPVLQQVSF